MQGLNYNEKDAGKVKIMQSLKLGDIAKESREQCGKTLTDENKRIVYVEKSKKDKERYLEVEMEKYNANH